VPKGRILTMRYTHDTSAANRRKPQLPAQRVHWGKNSSDEMCDLWIQVVPRSRSDHDLLVRELRQKVFREDILGYETVLRRTPADVSLHDDVALLYMATGRVDEAIRHFSESNRLAPSSAVTHFNLGTALAAAGRTDEAIARYRRTLELEPDYAHAHNNLGSLLLSKRLLDEAAAHFQRAIDVDPGYAEAHNNLGKLLAYTGRTSEAVDHLSRALAIRENYAEAHYNLGEVLVAQGLARDGAAHYRAAAAAAPEWQPALTQLSWLLATHPDEHVRDSAEAIRLAERAVTLTSRRDPVALDVLAAACAAAGRFDEAVAHARSAIDLLAARKGDAAQARSRLALYEQRQPYLDVRGTGPLRLQP